MQKKRLDILLVENELAPSREKAKAMILAGEVMVDGSIVTKAGENVSSDATITVKQPEIQYVSRGGLKLEKAINEFDISLSGKICADIGASTGGFTDVMLKNGAQKVYAVDVGYGQLAWSLRSDERVVVMERTNARYLTEDDFTAQFASVDVSFISLRLIFPALVRIGVTELVTLIKPQFEAGREKVGKKGVVRDSAVHEEVIETVFAAAEEYGFIPQALSYSPIKGPNGNIEYIAKYLRNSARGGIDIHSVVKTAHQSLDKHD